MLCLVLVLACEIGIATRVPYLPAYNCQVVLSTKTKGEREKKIERSSVKACFLWAKNRYVASAYVRTVLTRTQCVL